MPESKDSNTRNKASLLVFFLFLFGFCLLFFLGAQSYSSVTERADSEFDFKWEKQQQSLTRSKNAMTIDSLTLAPSSRMMASFAPGMALFPGDNPSCMRACICV